MGREGSKPLLVPYPMASFPWQQKAFADNTHFNPFGAYEVAKLVVMGLKNLSSPLVAHLLPSWQDFSPSSPDDWQSFYWPQSPLYDGKKPDGNYALALCLGCQPMASSQKHSDYTAKA